MNPSPLSQRLDHIRRQIEQALLRSGRPGRKVRLIGASKQKTAREIREAYALGVRDFGENYVQEWQKKRRHLGLQVTWHFIGRVQSNKVKALVGQVEWIQTVDRRKIAERISRVAQEQGRRQQILLEINLGGEKSKSGFSPDELLRSLPALSVLPNLACRGLMAIPPALDDPEASRPYFRRLKSLLDECNQSGVFKEPFTELSMGMSHDFSVAVEEGATMVRIGTALFGPRK